MQRINNNIKIEFYSQKNEKEYNNFILNKPNSTIYHTLEWKQILEKKFGYNTFYLIVKDSEGRIGAILPLFLVNNVLGKRLQSIPHSSYSEAIGEEKYINFLIKKAIELKEELNCKFLLMRGDPTLFDNIIKYFNISKFEPFRRQNVKIVNPLTMWNNLHKNNRTSIRKGKKNNLQIEIATKENELKEFYYLYSLTNTRLGLSPFSYSFFLDIWRKMYPKGMIKVFIVRYDGRAISSTLNFPFKNTLYSAYIGWDITKKSLKPNNYLDWYSILWCYKKGYKYFDFGLTYKEDKSLFSYKSSFNTTTSPYAKYVFPKNINYSGPQILLKKIGRKIISKTPLCINSRLGMVLNKYLT